MSISKKLSFNQPPKKNLFSASINKVLDFSENIEALFGEDKPLNEPIVNELNVSENSYDKDIRKLDMPEDLLDKSSQDNKSYRSNKDNKIDIESINPKKNILFDDFLDNIDLENDNMITDDNKASKSKDYELSKPDDDMIFGTGNLLFLNKFDLVEEPKKATINGIQHNGTQGQQSYKNTNKVSFDIPPQRFCVTTHNSCGISDMPIKQPIFEPEFKKSSDFPVHNFGFQKENMSSNNGNHIISTKLFSNSNEQDNTIKQEKTEYTFPSKMPKFSDLMNTSSVGKKILF